jgi:preprotein translocase subunit SecD
MARISFRRWRRTRSRGVPRNQKTSAFVLVSLACLGMTYTAVSGNRPLLGLDLQGGVSLVLQPTAPASDEALERTISILRNRVDALGVAEPEISRQGDTIVVDLPGVGQQQRALELVGKTAEMRFRPVLAMAAPGLVPAPPDPGQSFQVDADGNVVPVDPAAGDTVDPSGGQVFQVTPGEDGQLVVTPQDAPESDDSGSERAPALGESRTMSGLSPSRPNAPVEPVGDGDVGITATPGAELPSQDGPVDGSPDAPPLAPPSAPVMAPPASSLPPGCTGSPTAPEDDVAEQVVILADASGARYCLGPSLLTGDALESADAAPISGGQWQVSPTFRSGPDGIDAFNFASGLCYRKDPVACPTGQLAIVLDHQVIVAPTIQSDSFGRDQIQITGSFTQDEANDLSTALRYGALPVELEAQQTRTVSATIGGDALSAGLIAGAIGLALVALYLLVFYRLAGLVVIAGLGLSAMLLWSVVAWLGATQGLALTTAGIVGLIVAIGVAADSNIVYFENVKDDMSSGRKMTSSIERAYKSSIDTIVKADVVSLIAAVLLYWLTVGAVRGFAFYLGLATLIDLAVSWMFMRPALNALARSRIVNGRPRRLGLPVPATIEGGQS